MKELQFTPKERHRSAMPPPTLQINVWPVSAEVRDGQIEVISPRGKGVSFSAKEWYEMFAVVENALQSQLGSKP